jgi:hypothetical protein
MTTDKTHPGCTASYCWITGKNGGQATQAGCTCLRVLPVVDRLALERRIMGTCANCDYVSPDSTCRKILEAICCSGDCDGYAEIEVDAAFRCKFWTERKDES